MAVPKKKTSPGKSRRRRNQNLSRKRNQKDCIITSKDGFKGLRHHICGDFFNGRRVMPLPKETNDEENSVVTSDQV